MGKCFKNSDLARKRYDMHPHAGLPMFEMLQAFKDAPNETLAWEMIAEFYHCYGRVEAEDTLWLAVTSVMQAGNDDCESRQRKSVLWFWEYFRAFNAAVALLHEVRMK